MPSGKLESKFDEFAKAVRENEILSKKTTAMLHLAVTMAIGCNQ